MFVAFVCFTFYTKHPLSLYYYYLSFENDTKKKAAAANVSSEHEVELLEAILSNNHRLRVRVTGSSISMLSDDSSSNDLLADDENRIDDTMLVNTQPFFELTYLQRKHKLEADQVACGRRMPGGMSSNREAYYSGKMVPGEEYVGTREEWARVCAEYDGTKKAMENDQEPLVHNKRQRISSTPSYVALVSSSDDASSNEQHTELPLSMLVLHYHIEVWD